MTSVLCDQPTYPLKGMHDSGDQALHVLLQVNEQSIEGEA